MKKHTKNQTDNAIQKAWSKHGNGVQIPMLSIPKIFKACETAIALRPDMDMEKVLDLVVPGLVDEYRVN